MPYTFGLLKRGRDSEDQSVNADIPGYLDEEHPHFSIKLKAAIDAWKIVSNNLPKRKTPKEAVKNWLRKNAFAYELTKEDGSPNETGIEEIAKVVHWRTKGGALKTPEVEEKMTTHESEGLVPF